MLEPFARLGMREHVRATYGDERAGKTPAELVDEAEADAAIATAEECAAVAAAMLGAVAGAG